MRIISAINHSVASSWFFFSTHFLQSYRDVYHPNSCSLLSYLSWLLSVPGRCLDPEQLCSQRPRDVHFQDWRSPQAVAPPWRKGTLLSSGTWTSKPRVNVSNRVTGDKLHKDLCLDLNISYVLSPSDHWRPERGTRLQDLQRFRMIARSKAHCNVYVLLFCHIYVLFLCMLCCVYSVFIPATLNEGFPCFFLGCKANARVYLAKTGHGPHSS